MWSSFSINPKEGARKFRGLGVSGLLGFGVLGFWGLGFRVYELTLNPKPPKAGE